jgi:flagellar biosynthesis component FlhA
MLILSFAAHQPIDKGMGHEPLFQLTFVGISMERLVILAQLCIVTMFQLTRFPSITLAYTMARFLSLNVGRLCSTPVHLITLS